MPALMIFSLLLAGGSWVAIYLIVRRLSRSELPTVARVRRQSRFYDLVSVEDSERIREINRSLKAAK